MAAGASLVLKIIADVQDAQKGLEGVAGTAQKVGDSMSGLILPAGLAVGALAAMAGAAAQDQQEAARLEQAIKAAGAATGDYTLQVQAAIEAGQRRAFSDTESRDALISLVTATGSVTEATALLATSQDIARFAGVDLATAADAVAKAQAGQATQLTRLIPGLEKGKSATETLAAAQKLAAGQADAYAASTVGQAAASADAFAELGETMGTVLLPVLELVTGAMSEVANWMTQNSGVAKVLAGVIAVLAGGILAANIALQAFAAIQAAVKIATGLWTAAQWLLNAALAANPIGIVVIAIVALVAILALAWANSETFRRIVTDAFNAVARVVGGAIGGINDAIQGLIRWLGDAIAAVGRFLDAVNPLKNVKLPNLPFTAGVAGVPAPGVAGLRTSTRAVSTGPITVNVYTQADSIAAEQAVVRALRRVTRLNGGQVAALGWNRG